MPNEENVRVPIRFPKPVADRLKAEAEARMVSESLLVTKAVERYLATLPPVNVVTEPAGDDTP